MVTTSKNPEPDAEPHIAEANRQSSRAAAVLCLAIPGDVVLYLLLPLHAAVFGVSLPEVGILLAANRLVRIVGYGWVARGFERYGPRRTCTIAAITAAFSTLGYAVLSGVWALLVARLLWGLSFATLNIATQVLATSEPTGAARRSGRSRAIISTGPMVALVAGAALSELAGPRSVFLTLGCIAFLGLAFSLRLVDRSVGSVSGRPRMSLPSRLDMWSFIQGLTLDGLFVIGLSVLAAQAIPEGAALAAGCALALRYLTEMLLSPVGGSAADRWGAANMLVVCSLGCAFGLVLVGTGALWIGALAVVFIRGLLSPLPAPVVAMRHTGSARIGAIARVATWRDLGAGVGPLIAGALIPVTPSWALYGGAAVMLAAISLAVSAEHHRSVGR